jgi:hypothetical protein
MAISRFKCALLAAIKPFLVIQRAAWLATPATTVAVEEVQLLQLLGDLVNRDHARGRESHGTR